PPLGRAAGSRGAPETGHRDFPGDGVQVRGPPSEAPVADLAHAPRQTHTHPGLRGLLHRAHGDVQVLFVFVVLAHHRRRVVHCNVTDAPTAQWTAQQLVEAFPWETAPRYALRDGASVALAESVRGTSHRNPSP